MDRIVDAQAILCENIATRQWLQSIVSQLTPWKKASLKMVQESENPHSDVMIARFLWSQDYSTEKLLKPVESQNEGLNVTKWRIIKRRDAVLARERQLWKNANLSQANNASLSYTDGAKLTEGVGLRITGPNFKLSLTEVLAINICAQEKLKKGLSIGHIYTLSDSSISSEKTEQSLCSENFSCIPLRDCRSQHHTIYFPCHSGLNLYCCPNEQVLQPEIVSLISERSNFFPVECGVISIDDKITEKSVSITEFLCGGTLITDKYVLTAAHCIVVSPSHTLVTVRMGEHNLRTEKDCYTLKEVTICADPHLDKKVLSHAIHPSYNSRTLKNDIALVKTRESIKFTEYIQPICLPFERSLEKRTLVGQKFTISGWGKTDARKLGGSSVLQFASVTVWNSKLCNDVMPPEVKNISDTQICANGRKMDACKGDSGGPMFNTTLDIDANLRTFQIGIVSFATTLTCGLSELPPIYTRVDQYLDWIVQTVVGKKNDDVVIHFENK
ncbi:unnamed protein product [Ceutorhynchus assimilis]|uniref:Peptidase S1 domain-containing protein n=1 Tax=Ceutorhynchus assimilis TaxID=467358 RepID=A0A9N9MJI2_9CUCU|nr:unnamed protein product [Ceutorhynchus assimilis]